MTEVRPLPEATVEQLTLAASTYRSQMGDEGMAYLTGRGLDERTIAHFGLGYVADPITPDDDMFRGRISVPYIGPSKNIYGLKYRATGPANSKFLYPTGMKTKLYNTRAIAQAEDMIAVTEGEFDCMTLVMLGIPAVACPGVSTWKPYFSRIFADFSRVIFTGDNDDSSGEGRKWATSCAGSVDAGEVRMLPQGHDVNSLFCAEGPDAVLEVLNIKESSTV